MDTNSKQASDLPETAKTNSNANSTNTNKFKHFFNIITRPFFAENSDENCHTALLSKGQKVTDALISNKKSSLNNKSCDKLDLNVLSSQQPDVDETIAKQYKNEEKKETKSATVVALVPKTTSKPLATLNNKKLKSELSNLNLRDKKLDSILNRTLSDSILNKKSSSSNLILGIPNFKKTVGLSRKNSSNRRSILNHHPNIFNRSTSNIISRKCLLSPSTSPSPINFGFGNGSSNVKCLRKNLSQHRIQHHRSTCCVLNTSFVSNSSEKISSFNNNKKKIHSNNNEFDHQSSPISTPLSESPITVSNQLPFTNLSTPPLDSNGSSDNNQNANQINKRLPSSPRLHLTPATSFFNQKIGLPYNNQSLLITSFKNSDARRWSFASMNSSSGYGTNTPSNNIGGENSNSNQSLQYSSNEKLSINHQTTNNTNKHSKLIPHTTQSVTNTPERESIGIMKHKEKKRLEKQCSINSIGKQKKFQVFSLCGNANCQNCSNLSNSNDLFNEKAIDTNLMQFMTRSNRVSSSNESIQLDDSSEVGFSSPNSFHRQRARSLSCSPSKSHNDSDIIILHNEKFKEKYPKACTQMEENLQKFIDSNTDVNLNHLEQVKLNPAARFIHNQVIELAKLCLEKSKANQITCAYFDEITNSVEQLLEEAREKCNAQDDDTSVDYLRKLAKKFQLIVSRVSRLLDCLEFDPLEFCHLLDAAEEQARRLVKKDIPKYVISKLGLTKDPFEELCSDSESENSTNLKIKMNNKVNNIKKPNQDPKEEDFEQIKLISNGAYGAVYLVRHKQHKESRYAMKRIKKHNLILRNQLHQVFTERDIMTFTDNPFLVAMICTFETKKYLCMVMEYVEGGDVATLIKKIGPLGLDLARTYFAETTLAVEYLHYYGIIHRDLKPDNLLITADGHIKLTDFGLSKIGLMTLTTNFYEGNNSKNFMKDHYCKEFNDKQICGTPQYLAPEVILRQRYGKTVDWWSMGIIMYEFLTSVTPFNGNTPEELFERVIIGEVPWPDEDDELFIDESAKDLINNLLAHDPFKRLGAQGPQEIKEHQLFENLNWNNLLGSKGDFIPQLDSPDDTSYFDTRLERYNHDSDSPPSTQQHQKNSSEPKRTNNLNVKSKKSNNNSKNNANKLLNVNHSSKNGLKHHAKGKLNKANVHSKANKNDQLADLFNDKLKIKNDSNENVLLDDTDNELFASFSSCSSKFRLSSVSNTNSPVFMNEPKHSSLQMTKSNSFVYIGNGNNNNPSSVRNFFSSKPNKSNPNNCELLAKQQLLQDEPKYSTLPLLETINLTDEKNQQSKISPNKGNKVAENNFSISPSKLASKSPSFYELSDQF